MTLRDACAAGIALRASFDDRHAGPGNYYLVIVRDDGTIVSLSEDAVGVFPDVGAYEANRPAQQIPLSPRAEGSGGPGPFRPAARPTLP